GDSGVANALEQAFKINFAGGDQQGNFTGLAQAGIPEGAEQAGRLGTAIRQALHGVGVIGFGGTDGHHGAIVAPDKLLVVGGVIPALGARAGLHIEIGKVNILLIPAFAVAVDIVPVGVGGAHILQALGHGGGKFVAAGTFLKTAAQAKEGRRPRIFGSHIAAAGEAI